jgi:hypothetical protein
MDDDDLLEALGVSVETKSTGGRTPKQERVIAGFEDILNFVKEHGRPPAHGEDRDIFERLYAVRLDRLRAEQEFRDWLAPFDDAGLLSGEFAARPAAPEPADDDALLAELGVGAGDVEGLSTLKHVKPRAEVHAAAEEIANRTVCKDFEQFKPLFAQVQKDLEKGLRKTRSFQTMAEIKKSEFFIVGGQRLISRRSAKNFARNTTGATPACALSLTMERKATS